MYQQLSHKYKVQNTVNVVLFSPQVQCQQRDHHPAHCHLHSLSMTVKLLLYCFKCSLQDRIISNNRGIYPSNSRYLKRFGDQLAFFFHHFSCLHHPVGYLLLEVFLIFLPCQQIQRQIHKWFQHPFNICLQGLLTKTSRGWSLLIKPPGITQWLYYCHSFSFQSSLWFVRGVVQPKKRIAVR